MINRSRLLDSVPKPASEINTALASKEQIAPEAFSKSVVSDEQNQDTKDQSLESLQQTFGGITFLAKNRNHS